MCALCIGIGATATLQMDHLMPKLHLDAPSIGISRKESQAESSLPRMLLSGKPQIKKVCDKARDKFCEDAADPKILQAVAKNNILESSTRKASDSESQEFFGDAVAANNDADWDAVTSMEEEDQEECASKFDRRALELSCANKEHDAKVQCMVDGLFNSQKGAMHINESDGKIQVIDSVSGKILFEDTIGDVGQLLEQRVVGMVE